MYKAQNVNKLQETKSLEHPASHLTNHELVSDRPGREIDPGHRSHVLEERISPKQLEKDHFAKELVDDLEEACKTGECERLYIIANPGFLHLLRAHMSDALAERVVEEIHKDLTLMSAEEIRHYLPPVL